MSAEPSAAPSSSAEAKGAKVPGAVLGWAERVVALVRAHPVVTILLAIGLVLRIGRYLHDRSLWLDEASLAVNLTSRSYSHLFGTLDFEQGAPVGFLLLEKFAISTLGDSERVFRLFPLLAGIASLFVFWRVAVRFLDRSAAMLALAFFAVLEPFVYYSSETKQYSFDVLMTLLILWTFDRALSSERLGPLAVFASVGIVSPWLSHASVFVLAGTGVALILSEAVARNWRRVILTAAVGAGWLVSFGVVYAVSIRHLNSELTGGLSGISSGGSGTRVLKSIYVALSEPGAMPRTLIGLAAVLMAIGIVVMWRQRWPRVAALLLTGVAAAIAGRLGRYPLEERWALFLVPLELLLLSLGAVWLIRSTKMPIRGIAYAAVAVLLIAPAWQAFRHLDKLPASQPGTPATLQPTRRILAQLEQQWRPGDTLYLGRKSQFAFRYYLTCHDCNSRAASQMKLWPFRPIAGPSQTSAAIVPERPSLRLGSECACLIGFLDDFDKLRGKKRVWFLLTHTAPVDEPTLEQALDREGRQLAVIREGSSQALLYDLSKPPPSSS